MCPPGWTKRLPSKRSADSPAQVDETRAGDGRPSAAGTAHSEEDEMNAPLQKQMDAYAVAVNDASAERQQAVEEAGVARANARTAAELAYDVTVCLAEKLYSVRVARATDNYKTATGQ